MSYFIPHHSPNEMESELSSLEIGCIDMMDDVNIIPLPMGANGLPLMSPSNHSLSHLMGNNNNNNSHLNPHHHHHHRLDNDHLLVSSHELSMPYLLEHDLLRKRQRSSPISKNGDGILKNFDALIEFGNDLEESKKQRKPQVHKKCQHNTRKSECKLCGGSQICMHKRIKSRCKECGGSQICSHNKIRTRCKECRTRSSMERVSSVSSSSSSSSESNALQLHSNSVENSTILHSNF